MGGEPDQFLIALATSSSTAVPGPSNDDALRPPPAMISGDSTSTSSSLSSLTQAFPFSSGNPRIEETRGVMHLYRDDAVSSSSSSSSPSDLPVSHVVSDFHFKIEKLMDEKIKFVFLMF
jgi:hypothetical protein